MPGKLTQVSYLIIALAAWATPLSQSMAHHILGRPAYSLDETSNTPPAMQVETKIGDYFVNYMVYPAFPRPDEPGRINLYLSRIDNGKPFAGKVTFKVRDNSWAAFLGLGENEETLGVQALDDSVFRQGFVFKTNGDYLISAAFDIDGEAHVIDFPLRIGSASPVGPVAIGAGALLLILVGVSLIQRRRAMTGKIRRARERSG